MKAKRCHIADAVILLARPDLPPRHELFARSLIQHGLKVAVLGPKPRNQTTLSGLHWDPTSGSSGRGWQTRIARAWTVARAAQRWQSRLWILTHPLLLRCAGRLEGRVVYDVPEFWELELRQRVGRAAEFILPFWRRIERSALARVDLVTTVDSKDDRQARRFRALGCRVETVYNVPSKSDDPPCSCDVQDVPNLVYVGGVRRSKGLMTMLLALHHCREAHRQLKLILIGPLLEHPEWFARTLERLGLRENVLVLPHMPYADLQRTISGDRIGLALSERNALACQLGLGNGRKLFTYMQAGLPVVISRHAPGAQTVMQTSCGMTVDERRPADVAAAISTYLADPSLRFHHGENARQVFETRYCWEKLGRHVTEEFVKLAQSNASDSPCEHQLVDKSGETE